MIKDSLAVSFERHADMIRSGRKKAWNVLRVEERKTVIARYKKLNKLVHFASLMDMVVICYMLFS